MGIELNAIKNRGNNSVELNLTMSDKVHVLSPGTIKVFGSADSKNGRADKLKIKHLFTGREAFETVLAGPCYAFLALAPGCHITLVDLDSREMLVSHKNILFYSEGIRLERKVLPFKHMFATKELFQVKLTGEGKVGLMSIGELIPINLSEDYPVFIQFENIVSIPLTGIECKISTYGNELAKQVRGLHYEVWGKGAVLIETVAANNNATINTPNDNLAKRILRKILPWGDVYIK